MSERLGSLPSDKKKEFKPAWGFNASSERNYGESNTCNTARVGDLSSHNPYGEDEGGGIQGAASFEGAGEGSLPETWRAYQEPVDRRTWNKRAHDKTGLSAKQKLQCLAAPAGHNTLAGGLVAPRNFEVIEPVVEAVSYVVPEDVRLVVASAVAHTPGAAHHVSLVVDNLEESGGDGEEGAAAFPLPAARRSFYALLTPHAAAAAPGGTPPAANACAQWVARALPRLLAQRLDGVRESAAVKEAVKAAFDECDAQLLAECARQGWADGCGVVGLLLDLHCSPPRAYVASLGAAQAFACAKEPMGLGTGKAVAVAKTHVAADPKERRRVEAAGGAVDKDGLLNGQLPVARSLGDAAAKAEGRGLVARPEVGSFEIKAAQRFVLLGSEGLWRGFNGQLAVDKTFVRLNQMDARRAEIDAMMGDEARLALKTPEQVKSMGRERDERATEAGVLAEVVQQAVEAKRARPQQFSLLLVRLLQPKDKTSASVMRAAAAKAEAEARAAARAAAAEAAAAEAAAAAEEAAAAEAATTPAPAEAAAEAAAAEAALPPRLAAGGLGSAEEEEPEEELDEEERRLLAERETQRRAQDAREAEMRSEVVDFF
jgi:hypothetical protein